MIIAITGKIACGKSTVMEIFALKGFKTFNLDKRVKELYRKDSPVYPQLHTLLNCFLVNDRFDFRAIRKKIIKDDHLDARIKEILYRQLEIDLKPYIESEEMYIIEMPLVFEAGFDRLCKSIVYIDSLETEAKRRLNKRENFSFDEKLGLEKRMLPDWFKKERSTFIVINNDINRVYDQITEIVKKLRYL